ncbi:hypothetical protein BKA69DRAFT_1103859 [Paraphysoderma sedebokerense]|nr:hypothetical protein BKA69DRAFT_1103859 [Paraphysoderma sedebokerense]
MEIKDLLSGGVTGEENEDDERQNVYNSQQAESQSSSELNSYQESASNESNHSIGQPVVHGRIDKRRKVHMLSEQRRRQEMNSAFDELKGLLGMDGPRIKVIRAACERLRELELIMQTCPSCTVYTRNTHRQNNSASSSKSTSNRPPQSS